MKRVKKAKAAVKAGRKPVVKKLSANTKRTVRAKKAAPVKNAGAKKQPAADEDAALRRLMSLDGPDDRPEVLAIFARLRGSLPMLRALLARCDDHWGAEDGVYRFYHQSFKVYGLQTFTTAIVAALQALAPERTLNVWFAAIVADGTGKAFTMDDNQRWLAVTRPIVEAFFHARYFLEMAVRYGEKLKRPPRSLPSGWAMVLYLYDLR